MPEFKTIVLTSPHMHGDHVKEAQYLLQGNNRWKQQFYTGVMDGEYGEATAAATRRAKWYLGFPLAKTKGYVGAAFGKYTLGYLLDDTHPNYLKLPPLYASRRKSRAAQVTNWHTQAIPYAMKYLDYKESPFGSNQTIFNRWFYGSNVQAAWCLIFCSYVINHCGGPKWFKYSYVPDVVSLARNGTHGMAFTGKNGVGHGGIVAYDWEGNGVADHAELFDKWIDKSAGTFYAVGGNTGEVNQSNGGEVLRQERYYSNVQHFIHVP